MTGFLVRGCNILPQKELHKGLQVVTSGPAGLAVQRGAFKASSGAFEWYRSNYGTDFEMSEIASPVRFGIYQIGVGSGFGILTFQKVLIPKI